MVDKGVFFFEKVGSVELARRVALFAIDFLF